jgi:nicotinate phosphoribosyltransferase
VRRLPRNWGYLVAAGLDEALRLLEGYAFAPEDVEGLASLGLFGDPFLERLKGLRFTGEVRALPEGTAFFPDEPVLEVTAPLLEGQLVETLLLNVLHYDSLVAAKASRCVTAARGRRLVEFGARRAHGRDAAVRAARASYLAGFDSTSNVLAGLRHGIPVSGTMAHSFVESFDREDAAFRAFARARPEGATLLIDTYDTCEGARRAARVAGEVEREGARVTAVRLDSGDLAALARDVRGILDAAGRPEMRIFASGGLDEAELARLVAAGAPIDGFGVGTRLATVADAPSADMAYKLVELDGRPVLKLSEGKATIPCRKQVWRTTRDGVFAGDVIAHADEPAPAHDASPLLVTAMRAGVRCHSERLDAARARHVAQRAALPGPVLSLDGGRYPVSVTPRLRDEQARAASTSAG